MDRIDGARASEPGGTFGTASEGIVDSSSSSVDDVRLDSDGSDGSEGGVGSDDSDRSDDDSEGDDGVEGRRGCIWIGVIAEDASDSGSSTDSGRSRT